MLRSSWVLGIGLLVMACLVGSVETGEKKDPGKIKGQLPPGWKTLNLTLEQKAKVYTVQNEYKAKINELGKQIKDLLAQERAEMVKVLTDEQKTALQKLATGETGKETPPAKKEEPKKEEKTEPKK